MNHHRTTAARLRAVTTLLLTLAFAAFGVVASDSNPPELMTYQGYLVDANQAPLGSTTPKNYNVVFRIYDASQGGTELWAEQQTVTVDKGNFSVLLGEGSAVDANHGTLSSLFTGVTASDRFIGLTVTGLAATDVEIAPRLRLMPSAYAFTARRALALVSNAGDTLLSAGNGFVGIKTITPASELDVNGTITATNVNVNGPLAAASLSTSGELDANTLVVTNTATANAVNANAGGFGALVANALTVNGPTTENGPVQINSDLAATGQGTFNTVYGATWMWSRGGVYADTGFFGYGVVPVGGIIMWSGSIGAIPDGWHLCDGGANTPDLRNRFVVGAGNAYGVGAVGGQNSVTLSEHNLPPHTHGYTDGYYVEASGGGINGDSYYSYTLWGSHATDGDNHYIYNRYLYTGDTPYAYNWAFDVRPPYYALAFIMRTK